MNKQKVIIIGAGLSGSLLAIYLAKKNIEVEIYEWRGDMRKEKLSAGRSINLALSNRGIAALKEVGLDEYMLSEAVPMFGRMIHTVDGQTKLLPYSGRSGEYINSVSRGGLNIALINEAEKYAGVKFFFNNKCVDFDFEDNKILIGDMYAPTAEFIRAGTVISTDGAGSAVRDAMFGRVSRFDFSQKWLEHGYKELHIPPSESGDFRMEKNALHIWARGSFMMIALPNFDGSFTCTLFLAHKGENSFESIIGADGGRDWVENKSSSAGNSNDYASVTEDGSDRLLEFFEKYFADAIPLMPTLVEDFFANPIGNLGTIKCFPWNVGGQSLLLGDAAHAVVPFYGQGMNASFEDCRIFNELVETYDGDWEKIFDEFTHQRKPNTDAIADMAEENFYEMRDAVADPVFQRKRELETKLEQTFPDYFSKYSMVTFREDLPYAVAKEKGNAQDKLLMEICSSIKKVDELNLNKVMEKITSL